MDTADSSIREQLHRYYDLLGEGICIILADGSEKVVFASEQTVSLYECGSEEAFLDLCAGNYRNMMSSADYVPLSEMMKKCTDCCHLIFHFLTRNGKYSKAEGIVRLRETPFGKAYIIELFSADLIAEERKSDGITNLPGSHDFYTRAFELAEKHRAEGTLNAFCPVFFDVTHFREYNRLHGTHRGNQCLRKIAETITGTFPEALVGHLTADRFAALLPNDGLALKLEQICHDINRFIGDDGIRIKAGIYRAASKVSEDDIRHAFDSAKAACDSIKTDGNRLVAVYDPFMGELINKKMYILRNFNEALEKRYIKVYLQPVERTLTGSLCGFEALARWDDPSMGMISPSVFVPILEEAQLINRLDRFVLERVLGILRDRMDNGLPLIPVSINLSGCDFEVSNPFYTIEKLVSRYKVPRGALRFEITERVMIRHRNSMVSIISQFQKAGYQIWMDDFGSEYSSLNSLHNYHFDEIKIDMGFFSHFDDRSRQIITAVVVMAKMLGVMTLAEGVETEEQVEFLKKIGCGRIQGYYFGQPMPYEEWLEFIHDKNLKIESQTECSMLDPAENVNVNSELPTAIFYFDGNEIMLLLENDAYRRELRSTGTQSLQEANLNLRAMDHPLRNRFFGLLTKALKSRTEESMIYVDNGQYIKVSVQWIAGSEQKWVGATRLYNISTKSEIQSEKILDSFLRNMFHIYDGLYMLDREKDEIRVLQCVHPKVHPGENFRHILSSFQAFTEELVHPEDQKRFLDFIRPENLEMETFHTAGNSVSELVRVRREDGTYRWTIFEALVIYKSRTKNILLCEREDIWEKKRDREKLLPAFCRSFNAGSCNCGGSAQPLEMSLFRTLQTYSPYPFFWKGRNGRILGTSTALRKLAGLPDEKAVLGKTEAELGWLIDPSVVESTESKVLHGGERLELTTEQVLTDGRLQKIGIAWAPFYQEKNLIGALGMVGSRGEDSKGEEERLGLTDPDTGLLSFRGAIEAGLLYADQYRLQKVDYVGLLIKISAFSDIQRESPRLAVTLLAETVQTLHRVLTPGWTISRTGICSFLCFCHRGENTNIAGKVEILTESLKQLWKKFSLPGNPQMIAASVFGSETRSFDDMLQLLIRRLSSVENQLFGSSTYTGDRVIIRKEAFDKLTERVVISDPKTYELVYLNQAARTTLGIGPDESLEGKICYETLEGNDAPCRDCLNVLLRQDRFCCISHICRKTGENLLVRSCLIPWEDRILRFTFAFNMSEYINTMTKDHELVYQEMRANEVISLGITEENADRGIEKMIEYISNNLKPERFLIFEERDDSTVSATYEWTAPGILPLKEELQSVPREGLRALYKEFTLHHVVMISDIVAFRREHPDFNLRIYGAKSFISGQLTLPDRSEGFTMVVNPSQETFRQASLLLSTLTDFIAVMIRNRNSMRRLEELSMRDQLTGVRNRWGLEKQVREWKDESLLGVISVDLNGLKKTNDIQGHHAGDMLIQEAARILGECAGRECVFRVGGDEFIVLTKEMEENDIRLLVRHIRDTAQDNGISMALGYAVSTGIDADTDTLLTRADLKMYDDKAHSLYRRRDD